MMDLDSLEHHFNINVNVYEYREQRGIMIRQSANECDTILNLNFYEDSITEEKHFSFIKDIKSYCQVFLHFVQLALGNKAYRTKVSTEGCSDVDDFRDAIKKKFSPELDSYAPHHLTLLQPHGTTEIDPGEAIAKLNEFNVGPWTPLVVIAHPRSDWQF